MDEATPVARRDWLVTEKRHRPAGSPMVLGWAKLLQTASDSMIAKHQYLGPLMDPQARHINVVFLWLPLD